MTESEAAAQAELRKIVKELGNLYTRLEAIRGRLLVPAEEAADFLEELEMDISTEMRSVIECVLNDSLRPAMRDLEAAASYFPAGEGEE